MIDGMKLQVSAEELKDHFLKRAGRCREYAEKCQGLMVKAKKDEFGAPVDPYGIGHAAISHENKADDFEFLAQHLDMQQDYWLSIQELRALELISAAGA